MKTLILTTLLLLMSCKMDEGRYLEAAARKESLILNQLDDLNINADTLNLYLRAFKKEEILEVWVRDDNQNFKMFATYPFCISSGTLGPKRKEGDKQIPEGVYHINRYNPKSKFHLSLGINYPNKADLVYADVMHPGSDIFIHGGCSSVGCIAITNEKIKALYVLASIAKANSKSQTRVDIYPYKFDHKLNESSDKLWEEHNQLWTDLKNIYTEFQKSKVITPISISNKGRYLLDEKN